MTFVRRLIRQVGMPEHPESEAAIVGLDKEIEHAPRCPDQGPAGEYRMFLEQVAATR